MIIYENWSIYVNSATELKNRIANIKAVMGLLRAQRLEAAANGNISNMSEYSLDDGQTKIKTVYRSLNDINLAIRTLEQELQMCYNQLNGRMTRLVDGKNFNNFNNRR
jgi:hypothetical protein